MRRLAAIATVLWGAAACGQWQRVGSGPKPQPGAGVPALFDATALYRAMGLVVSGPPLPFVASLRHLGDATPDSTLVLFGLSLTNHALSFQRDRNEFVAQYRVEVDFRTDSATVRRLASDQSVRVRTFQETLRADESVIFQEFVGVPPGSYRVSVVVRDRNAAGTARQESVDTVPRFTGRTLTAPIPVYEGTGRASPSALPKLLVNPRATLPYGADSLRFYVEGYGFKHGSRVAAWVTDQGGRETWRDTLALAGTETLATARIVLPPAELTVGRAELALHPVDGAPGDETHTPFLVSFSDQWAITNFDEMISLLRYFDRQDWVTKLRQASPADRPSVWREFFKATDPVAITPENEALDEYFKRIQVANQRFREGADLGWLTDRGEVFITLGEPDEIYDFSTDIARTGARGFRWTYNSLRSTLFFIDQSGFGRFRLTPQSRAEFQRALARVRRSQ